jgi:hypothetical protein
MSLRPAFDLEAGAATETASAAMTPAEQAAPMLETHFSVRRRQRGGKNVESTSVSEMEALRARIRS